MNLKLYKYITITGLGVFASLPVLAQTESSSVSSMQSQLLWFLVFALLLLALTILTMTFTIMALLRKKREEAASETITDESGQVIYQASPALFSWKNIRQKLTDAVPIAREGEIDLGHDYDGIRELDNNLPPWWKYGFYFSIVFSVVYLFIYHLPGSDWSSDQEYQEEMAEAAIQKEEYLKKVADMVNESNVEILTDGASLASGKNIYMASCLPCHGDRGQGGVGPNLTDNYWINGGSISDIFKTIKYGVPEKGMIAWQDQLKPKEMQEVASFITTFQGTNPPDGKDPQGDLYEPDKETTPAEADSASVAMVN